MVKANTLSRTPRAASLFTPVSAVNISYGDSDDDRDLSATLRPHHITSQKAPITASVLCEPVMYGEDPLGEARRRSSTSLSATTATPLSSAPSTPPHVSASPVSSFEFSSPVGSAKYAHFVDEEVRRFVHGLQEPKYSTPLSGDELGMLFQKFYIDVKTRVDPARTPNGSKANEDTMLLSSEEMQARKSRPSREEKARTLLDLIERRACEPLYQKLLDNISGDDLVIARRLEARKSALHSHVSLREELNLPLDPELLDKLVPASVTMGEMVKQHSPIAKLEVILRVHQTIVSAMETQHSGADMLLPAFIHVLILSEASDLYKSLLFIRRFRRAEALAGEHGYCLTNLEAALHVLDSVTFNKSHIPEGLDADLFTAPAQMPNSSALNARNRSGSQSSRSSRSSSGTGASIAARFQAQGLMGTNYLANGYRYFVSRLRREDPTLSPPVSAASLSSESGAPRVVQRFLNAEADNLTLADVRVLLAEYKRLANHVGAQ